MDSCHVTWLLYGNEFFIKQHKECLLNSQILTYTLLLVMIIGLIHVAKFTFILLALIVWCLAKALRYPLDFSLFGSDESEQTNLSLVRVPLFQKPQGLHLWEIEKLPRVPYQQNSGCKKSLARDPTTEATTQDDSNQSLLRELLLSEQEEEGESLGDPCPICCSHYADAELTIVLPCHRSHSFHV